MSFTARLCVFVLAVAAAWWSITPPADPTPLALQQFQNDDAVPEQLRQTTLAQNHGPLVLLGLALALAAILFWDEIEGWWKQDAVSLARGNPEEHSCEKSTSP